MTGTMDDVIRPGTTPPGEPEFPNAPTGWSSTRATAVAGSEQIEMEDAHWEVIRALQEFYARNDEIRVRVLHDALNERFHHLGGMKYLYLMFPGGPVAQGCRIAGLQPPAGSTDHSFGSVQ